GPGSAHSHRHPDPAVLKRMLSAQGWVRSLFKEGCMKTYVALAGILALLAACSHEGKSPSSKSDWGTGLNTVERKYNKTASDTFDAAVAAVKSFDLTIDQDKHAEFDEGVRAAERSVTELGYTVIGKEVKEDWATIDARAEDSTPVRIKVER